jgi:biotin operon repressor
MDNLARALEWQRQLEAGEAESQAAIARREGLTRARVTQIMNRLRDLHHRAPTG